MRSFFLLGTCVVGACVLGLAGVACDGDATAVTGGSGGGLSNGGAGGAGTGGETTTANGGQGGDPSGTGGTGGVGGAGGALGTLPIGTAVEDADCTPPAQAPPGTTCKQLTITCPEVPDESVDAIIYPAVGTERGTVVLGTGGFGTGHYNQMVVGALRQAGFRVVTRAWDTGWENGDPGGMARAACRYATLVTWVHDQMPTDQPLCVSGNSGGNAEISYALARYGRDSIIDLAVPTGGPPMGRLDYGCVGDATWVTECETLTAATACAGSAACTYNPNARGIIDAAYSGTPCTSQDTTMSATWQSDSIASPDAQLDYPNTPVRFIFGAQDCTSALPLGLLYANAVTSDKTIDFVDAPHAVFSTAPGRAAIVAALDGECGN